MALGKKGAAAATAAMLIVVVALAAGGAALTGRLNLGGAGGRSSLSASSAPVSSAAPSSSAPASSQSLAASLTVCMAGDFMLHKGPEYAGQTGANSYDFTPFMKVMQPYVDGDLNMTDIEGIVDAYGGDQKISSYPLFNYPFELLDAIKFVGFDSIITANNHAFDQKWDGLLKMRANVTKAGLTPIGTYESQQEYDSYYIKDINGIKVGVVAWSALDNGNSPWMGDHLSYCMRLFNQATMDDVPRMLQDVKNMRAQGAEVILMPLHWGAEYQDTPSDMQVKIAQALVDGGVDIIVGDHSHCQQPIDVRTVQRNGHSQKALIIYSLGNFFADQFGISPPEPETQWGMLVKVQITRDANGVIDLGTMNYMPTVCYRDVNFAQKGKTYGYALLPAGKYAEMTSQPAGITAATWQQAKDSWAHVRQAVGTAIPAYDGN